MHMDAFREEIRLEDDPPKVCEESYGYQTNSAITTHTSDAAELEDAPEG